VVNLIDAIRAVLRTRGEVVSSTDLVREVFKIPMISPDLAHKLVSEAVNGCPDIIDTGQGWRVDETCSNRPPTPEGIWLCVMEPVRALHRDIHALAFAWLENGHLGTLRVVESPVVSGGSAALDSMVSSLQTAPILFEGTGNQISRFRMLMRQIHAAGLPSLMSLVQLVRLLTGESCQRLEDIATLLGVQAFSEGTLEIRMRFLSECAVHVMERIAPDDLLSFFEKDMGSPDVDFTPYRFDREDILQLPHLPGVYQMLDEHGTVIYVGKAGNIHQRIQSYFTGHKPEEDSKVQSIRERIHDLKIMLCGSELEALLLEQTLIQELNPDINRQMEVHRRSHRKKSRYPRIVVLPASDPGWFWLYALHPEKGLIARKVSSRSMDSSLIQWIEQHFFSTTPPSADSVALWKMELALSWLAGHEDSVPGIDMRWMTTAQDASRQIHRIISDWTDRGERMIYYDD
jgi:hypothetical protein